MSRSLQTSSVISFVISLYLIFQIYKDSILKNSTKQSLIAGRRPFHFEPGEDLCLPVQISVLVPGSELAQHEQLLVFPQIADSHEEYTRTVGWHRGSVISWFP